MEVKAYTNASTARLSINGKPVGEVACADSICLWPAVALAPGSNRAVVTASSAGVTVEDSAEWIGPDPLRTGIAIDAGDLAGRIAGGRQFGSDNFVTGGVPMILNLEGFGRKAANPRKVETPTPSLFDYWREGEAFSYAIPLPDGRWTVTIHTFEPSSVASGATTMTVSANGKVALPAFSVQKQAGGPLKALERSFPVTVTGGLLKLDFAGSGGRAVVAAITVDR
ncbi:beta-galactosidase/beta-glucuronidase [Sphingomonas sp. LH128]|uniref:malectin domain-containing carbohydrate-binding protein n=1 Tax=Sphingomonas sp. LH128 TaxID=473781 RepID=UPI00027CA339|nr:malectin domain-containing carbohydrate-binding protein [Sphingomonas sp. LH128]EJU13439.1 beta-galactosidase/beta-glucuronidase [Sphingomonas sp. LH128]